MSSASGCRASLRQRERMVGSSRPGACATISSTALGGGSSRIFSTALALLRFISSAESTMATRHCPIAGVMCMKAPSSRTSSTAISARMRPVSGLSVRRRWNRSGCERASTSERPGASAATSSPSRHRRRTGRPAAGRTAGSARSARPASPCRCRAVPPSARHDAAGRSAGPPAWSSRPSRGPAAGRCATAAASRTAIRASRARWHRRSPCPSPSVRLPAGRSPHRAIACGDRVDRPCSIDHDAALGLPRGDFEESGAHPGMEVVRQALVARLRAAPLGRAREPDLDRQVEDDREVGPEVAGGDLVELLEDLRDRCRGRSPGRRASNRRSGRSPPSRRACSAGHTVERRCSRRAAKCSSASVVPSQRSTGPSTRSLRIISAPGEPPGSRVATTRWPRAFEPALEPRDLGRLARPFAAFQGDEAPGRRRRVTRASRTGNAGSWSSTRPNTPMRGTSAPASSGYSMTRPSGSVTTAVPSLAPLVIGAGERPVEARDHARRHGLAGRRGDLHRPRHDQRHLVLRAQPHRRLDDGVAGAEHRRVGRIRGSPIPSAAPSPGRARPSRSGRSTTRISRRPSRIADVAWP